MRPLVLAFVLSTCGACADDGLTALERSLAAAPSAVAFQDTYVGGFRTANVLVTNDGTARTSLDSPSITGTVEAFDVRGVPASIAAGEVATLSVRFAPLAAGTASASVRLTSDADGVPVEIELIGNGIAPLECGDQNVCTDDAFDAQAGTCVRTNNTAGCDDASACTSEDRCNGGSCVGSALVCADGVACTTDVCDPSTGCEFLPNDVECDDGDPCTLDRCSASPVLGTGCTRTAVADGTPCGGFEPCASVDLCVSQQCTQVIIPKAHLVPTVLHALLAISAPLVRALERQ